MSLPVIRSTALTAVSADSGGGVELAGGGGGKLNRSDARLGAGGKSCMQLASAVCCLHA